MVEYVAKVLVPPHGNPIFTPLVFVYVAKLPFAMDSRETVVMYKPRFEAWSL